MTTTLSTAPLEPDLLSELALIATRCPAGFDLRTQHPGLCDCADLAPSAPTDEYAIFKAAVLSAAVDGVVHQSAVRPIIRGRVAPKHVGQFYARAKREGLLVQIGKEPSSDTAGRNTHHDSPIYELRSAA